MEKVVEIAIWDMKYIVRIMDVYLSTTTFNHQQKNKLENMILIGKILEKHVWSTIKNMHLVMSIKSKQRTQKFNFVKLWVAEVSQGDDTVSI